MKYTAVAFVQQRRTHFRGNVCVEMLYFEVEGETTQIWWALTHFFYFPLWSRAVVQDTEGWIRGSCAERHLSDTCSNAEADPVQALRGDVPKRARVLGAPENATPASKRARRDEALEEHEKR